MRKKDFSRNLLMFREKMNFEEHNQPISGSRKAFLTRGNYEHFNGKITAFFRYTAGETCGRNLVLFH
jgi:hypothetical protein